MLQNAYQAFNTGDYTSALKYTCDHLQNAPLDAAALNLAGICSFTMGEYSEAMAYLERAIKANPTDEQSYANLAKIYLQQKSENKLVELLNKAQKEKIISPLLRYYQGMLLQMQQKYNQATDIFYVLWQKDKDIDAALEYAVILGKLNRFADALSVYEQIENGIQPQVLHNNRANIYLDMGDYQRAYQGYEKALAYSPHNIELLYNLAFCRYQQKQYKVARDLILSALKIDSANIGLNCLLANVYDHLLEYDAAFELLAKQITLTEEININYLVLYLYFCLRTMRWNDFETYLEILHQHNLQDTEQKYYFSHFIILHLAQTPEMALKLSVLANKVFDASPESFYKHIPRPEDANRKIRLGYISSDFYNHCVAFLLNDTLKYHDREKFTVTAYYRQGNEDAFTEIIKQSVDDFVILDAHDFDAGAKHLNKEVDILIDLTGFTGDTCCFYFANKPCPVQVHMLGDLLPIASSAIDYCHDTRLMPITQPGELAEKTIQLRTISWARATLKKPATLSKSDLGLPQDKKIIACVGQQLRLTPMILRLWLDILQRNKDTVLWLNLHDDKVIARLRDFAKNYNNTDAQIYCLNAGVLSENGVLQHANVYLNPDILSCFTSAFLALDAEVPVVSLYGKTNFANGAVGLLNSINLFDCIVANKEEYIAITEKLLHDEAFNRDIIQRIQVGKQQVLNNPQQLIREFEQAFEIIWLNYVAGKKHEHVVL